MFYNILHFIACYPTLTQLGFIFSVWGGGGGLSWGAGAKECFLFGPTKQNSPLPYLMNELEKKFDKAMEQGIFCSGIH